MAARQKEPAIVVNSVSKNFKLPHEKTNSIKQKLIHPASFFKKNSTTQHALKDISFKVKEGEFFGIVGRNGSGKSTLLKILAQIYQPTSGSVSIKGKLMPFIELGVGFNPELTGRENVFLNGALLGFSKEEMEKRYEEIVDFAELNDFMDQKLKNYSSGMQVRLAFSIATQSETDIFLIDEVLAVGDAAFQRKCFDYFKKLKKENKTVVLVTHDMDTVREYCDRAIIISNGIIEDAGKVSRVADLYEAKNQRRKQAKKTQADIQNSNRWGDNNLQITEFNINKQIYNADDKYIYIKETVQSNKKLNDVVLGVSITDQAGHFIAGHNNKLDQKVISVTGRDETLKIDWKIPNIFNDGIYYINAGVNYGQQLVADKWNEAVTFTVSRKSKTGFLVQPDITYKINRKN